jgi:hypothetical protein
MDAAMWNRLSVSDDHGRVGFERISSLQVGASSNSADAPSRQAAQSLTRLQPPQTAPDRAMLIRA